jgi:hypothetical protein
MTSGSQLVALLIKDGVDFEESPRELAEDFDKAIKEGRFYPIIKNGYTIGFLTFKKKIDSVFIDKCVILKKFRNRFSLLQLRHQFRNMYKDMGFYWRSKRRNRYCEVR